MSPNPVTLQGTSIKLARSRVPFPGGVAYLLLHDEHPGLAFRLTYTGEGHLVSFEVGDFRAVTAPNRKLDFATPSSTWVPAPRLLSSRRFRSIPLGALDRFARAQFIREFRSLDDDVVRDFSDEPVRPGRRGHSEEFYVALVARYLEVLAAGGTTADLAEERNLSRQTISNQIQEARRKSLLSNPGQGTAGGVLTEKARRILKEMQET